MAKRTTATRKTTSRKTTAAAPRRKTATAKKTGKQTGKRKSAAKRELIDTGTDTRYVRRGAAGRFKESDDVGRSLSADRRTRAKTKVKSGQGDKGDRKR